MNTPFSKLKTRAQRGYTIVELLIVLAVIAFLTIIGVPWVRNLMISGQVEPTANDVQKVVAAMRQNFAGQGSTPYTSLGSGAAAIANFANVANGLASSLTVTGVGAAATVQHGLGATGAQLDIAQAQITTMGDAFAVTFPTVSKAACPGLATQLSKASEVITINGTAVKSAGGAYNGGTAPNLCTDGDTNTFVFTFR